MKVSVIVIIIAVMVIAIIPPNVNSLENRAPAIPPSPPQNLTADGSNGYVVLQWEPSSAPDEYPVSKYKIYRGESQGNETYYDSVDASTTEYVDRNVIVGERYWYYVTAVNDVGESNRSNEVNVTVQPATNAPTPPQNLRAEWNQTMVSLSWVIPTYDGGSPIICYNIYRNGRYLANTTLTSYTDSDIDIHKNYTYYVTAVNSAGKESNPSNYVKVGWEKPGAPQGLSARKEGSYIILSWKQGYTGNLKIKEYRIYVKYDDHWKLIGNTSGTTYKISISSLPSGQVEIKVTAVNELGEGAGSIITVNVSSENILPYVALGIAVAALLILAYILIRRRKSG